MPLLISATLQIIFFCYHLEYSDYWPHLYCYTSNVSANMPFGLLHVFHVELRIWTEPFIWTEGVDCSNSINHDQVQMLSYSKYSLLFLLIVGIEPATPRWYCGVCGWRSRAKGKAVLPFEYLTPYFGYFILPLRWLVGVMPSLPKKVPKRNLHKKTITDRRRRRFFYTFLYLLGSTTIPWMREFFLNIQKWLNPPLKVSKYVNRFMYVFVCIWYFGLP